MRMMVMFEKGEALRHIGHLDLMRTIQRALRRSGLPIKYSNGFNPHLRLSFAAPLSVGVVGLRELMEVPLEDGVTEEAFAQGMNRVLPGCLRIRACRVIDDSYPSLMALVAGSDYRITFPITQESEKALACFEDFMALDSYIATRRTKSGENPCDIRPFVKAGACERADGMGTIILRTAVTQAGSLKPSLWLECLCQFAGAGAFAHMIYRTAILTKGEDGALTPIMEETQHG